MVLDRVAPSHLVAVEGCVHNPKVTLQSLDLCQFGSNLGSIADPGDRRCGIESRSDPRTSTGENPNRVPYLDVLQQKFVVIFELAVVGLKAMKKTNPVPTSIPPGSTKRRIVTTLLVLTLLASALVLLGQPQVFPGDPTLTSLNKQVKALEADLRKLKLTTEDQGGELAVLREKVGLLQAEVYRLKNK